MATASRKLSTRRFSMFFFITIVSVVSATSSNSSIAKTLGELGFNDLAAASKFPEISAAIERVGPVTIFAPIGIDPAAVRSNLPLLLQELTVPGLYPFKYLSGVNMNIETILHGDLNCLMISSDNKDVFVSDAEITHPDLYMDENLIIHGVKIRSIIIPLANCASFHFSKHHRMPPSTSMMLTESIIRLRATGYSALSLALQDMYYVLGTLNNMTIFAVDDQRLIDASGNPAIHHNLQHLKLHIVPNRILDVDYLNSLPASTRIRTLDQYLKIGQSLKLWSPQVLVSINNVEIKTPHLFSNKRILVHQLVSPFPHSSVGNYQYQTNWDSPTLVCIGVIIGISLERLWVALSRFLEKGDKFGVFAPYIKFFSLLVLLSILQCLVLSF